MKTVCDGGGGDDYGLIFLLKNHPKVELTASNNVINIRTCSDSFTVLAELINYLARCGDLDNDARSPKELHSVTGFVTNFHF